MIDYVIYCSQIVKVINLKKNYIKPALYFEDFSIMDAITTGCGYPAQHADKTSCSCDVEFGDILKIFIDGNNACQVTYEPAEVGIPADFIFPS